MRLGPSEPWPPSAAWPERTGQIFELFLAPMAEEEQLEVGLLAGWAAVADLHCL